MCRGLAVRDRYAYVAVSPFVQVIDVSNPAVPFITGAEIVPFAFDVAVSGRHAYVSSGVGGVQVIDITDPTSPLLVGAFEVSGISKGVTASDQHVYVAAGLDYLRDEPGGLRVAWLQCDSVSRDIRIDVKPGNSSNSVNPYSRGVIPVSILGSETFDVAGIDLKTVRFGPGGAEPAHSHPGHAQDVNLDGFTDLLTHFRTQDTGIACGDDSATLTGVTTSGESFEGSDSIRTVGCRQGRRRFRGAAEPE